MIGHGVRLSGLHFLRRFLEHFPREKKENLKTSPASDVQVLIVILLKKMIIIIVSIIMKHVRQIVKFLYSN